MRRVSAASTKNKAPKMNRFGSKVKRYGRKYIDSATGPTRSGSMPGI